jgi:hypothetical protein
MLTLGQWEIETENLLDLVVSALLTRPNVDEVEKWPSKAKRSPKF